MSRVEKIGDCTLYLGDCRDVLPGLGNGFAVVTDPPYGIDENDKKVASRGKLAKPKDYGKFSWDKEPPDPAIIAAILKMQGRKIVWGGNYFGLPGASGWLVWDKQNGSNDFADCELAWTDIPMACRRIYWRWNGMIRKGGEERFHPTQKPVGVMAWALAFLSQDLPILDPFMGSGTTGVACVQAGRSFVGVEKDPGYFAIACQRIADEVAMKAGGLRAPEREPQEAML